MTSEEIKRDMQAAANLATQAGASGDVTTAQTATLSIALLEVAYQLAVANEREAKALGITWRCEKCGSIAIMPRTAGVQICSNDGKRMVEV